MLQAASIPLSEFSFLRMYDALILTRCWRNTGYYYITHQDIIGYIADINFTITTENSCFDLYYPHVNIKYLALSDVEKRQLLEEVLYQHSIYPNKFEAINPFPEFTLATMSSGFSYEMVRELEYWQWSALELDDGENIIRTIVVPLIQERLEKLATIIDIGCSTGTFLSQTVSQDIPGLFLGFDKSYPMCSISKGKGLPTVCCDAVSLPIFDNAVDIIVCRILNKEVVSLLTTVPILNECYRVLKNEGLVYVFGYTQTFVSVQMLEACGFMVENSLRRTPEGIIPLYVARKRTKNNKVRVGGLQELFELFPYCLFGDLKDIFAIGKTFSGSEGRLQVKIKKRKEH